KASFTHIFEHYNYWKELVGSIDEASKKIHASCSSDRRGHAGRTNATVVRLRRKLSQGRDTGYRAKAGSGLRPQESDLRNSRKRSERQRSVFIRLCSAAGRARRRPHHCLAGAPRRQAAQNLSERAF